MAVGYYSSLKHPRFDNNKNKIRARNALIYYYYELTGKRSLSKGEQYWTLCSNQTTFPGAEIQQLINAKFLKQNQYYGVDISPVKICRNVKRHPKAHWFSGEWVATLQEHLDIYHPSIVYLDTCSVLEMSPSIELTAATLEYTQSGVVFINLMQNNPHNGNVYTIENFIKTLVENISPECREQWDLQKKICTYICSKRTKMITMAFTKDIK